MSTRKRSPSPSPTVTLDAIPKPDLQRSSSEESVRVIHHAVLFPSSPHLGRVTYIRRAVESDSELIRRQLAAIALQPLTFAEELAAKRKQLEIRAQKRKMEKAGALDKIDTVKSQSVPEITVVPASGKVTPSPSSPTKMKTRTSLKDKTKLAPKSTTTLSPMNRQRTKQGAATQVQQLGLGKLNGKDKPEPVSNDTKKLTAPLN